MTEEEKAASEYTPSIWYDGYVPTVDFENEVEKAFLAGSDWKGQKAIRAFMETCFHRDRELCSISPEYDEEIDDYSDPCKCEIYCNRCSEITKFIKKLQEE